MTQDGWYFIDALDVLFFRDGRSFEAGEGRVAHSLFPPHGSTVWGAIRGAVLRCSGTDVAAYRKLRSDATHLGIGTPDTLGPLEHLTGPFVAQRDGSASQAKLLFPWPADCVTQVLRHGIRMEYVAPVQRAPFAGCCLQGLCPLWVRQPATDSPIGRHFANSAVLAAWQLGLPRCSWPSAKPERYWQNERRAGNALQEDRTVREGYLYSLDLANPYRDLRTRGGIAFGIRLTETLGVPGSIQLGGESKWARLEETTCSLPAALPEAAFTQREKNTLFKTYLATPAVFANGWRPDWIAPTTLTGTWPGGPSMRLVSIALGEGSLIGGFDLAQGDGPGRSRGSHHAVPAGSVYFFEAEATPSEVLKLHGQSLCDKNDDRNRKLGLGLSLIGRWDYA